MSGMYIVMIQNSIWSTIKANTLVFIVIIIIRSVKEVLK